LTMNVGIPVGIISRATLSTGFPRASYRSTFEIESGFDAGTAFIEANGNANRTGVGMYFDGTSWQTSVGTAPRYHNIPGTSLWGWLIEPQRTNSIRNNTMQGAVVGNPGTQPTNWTIVTPAIGLTRQIVATGVESGITYIDVRYSGTTSGTTTSPISPDTTTSVAALQGQTWTGSFFLRLVAGSLSGVTTTLVLGERDGSGAGLVGNQSGAKAVTSTLTRFDHTATLSNASTAYVISQINFAFANGVALDFTLRVGLPQLELGANASSPIETTAAAVTRTADLPNITDLTAIGFNAVEGTFVAKYAVVTPGAVQYVLAVSDGTADELLQMGLDASSKAALTTTEGGVSDGSCVSVAAVTANTPVTVANRYIVNNLGLSKDGATVVADTSATLPVGVDRLDIGSDYAGANATQGMLLQAIEYYQRALPNAQVQAAA